MAQVVSHHPATYNSFNNWTNISNFDGEKWSRIFILKFTVPLQSCCCPVQKKICPERLNWPGRLAGISFKFFLEDLGLFLNLKIFLVKNLKLEKKSFKKSFSFGKKILIMKLDLGFSSRYQNLVSVAH